MKIPEDDFEKLLSARAAQDIKTLLALRGWAPSLQQAGKLRKHIASLQADHRPVRLGIVHTYTSELLDPWLHFAGALNRIAFDIYHAPYGTTVQETDPASGLARHAPDLTLLLLTKEDLHPAFRHPAACIRPADRDDILLRTQETLLALVHQFRQAVAGHIVVTVLPDLASPALGLYDGMAEHSETLWWHRIKDAVTQRIRNEISGASYIDIDNFVMQTGRDSFFDRRLWYSSAFPFSSSGALSICNAVASTAAAIHHTRAKVIVLDADNTLWGGVIGEDGMHGIALGQDYPGRTFVDFQKRLLGLQQRGFILALCSKNNPEDLAEVLEHHPHQILKNSHFAAQRVNWLPKPDNLRSIAEELNLGLDSFIFVDDSDHECSAVRHSLPEVEVIQVPARPVEVPHCLDAVARLEIISLTSEDLEKTSMYAQERLRRSQLEHMTTTGGSVEDYLGSLNMCMTLRLDDRAHVARLAQLTQKTNQFNLTTRRYSESDITGMIDSEQFSVYHFSLADNFGSSGIVGLAIVEHASDAAPRLDSFLMSCRVIGRRAERAFLSRIVSNLRSRGMATLAAEFIPTRKNIVVEDFLPESGFQRTGQGCFRATLDEIDSALGADFPITIEGP